MAKTYTRRTPDQIVAELEAKIASVRARAAAREMKQSADGSAFIAAVRAIQKAQRVAQKERNDSMDRAFEAALAELARYAVEAGMRMPEPRERKGGKRRKAAVA